MTAGVQIGFSQRIRLEWLERTAALYGMGSAPPRIREVLRGLLQDQISVGGVSPSSNREKAISILMRTWVQVPDELRPLRDEGIAHLRHLPPEEHVVVHWGMALAVYPFFGEVAESAGRLLRLQGTAASAQIQRRLCEQHGQRESIARAARRVLRCYIDWGVLAETKRKGIYQAAPPRDVDDAPLTAWLLEAALRSRHSNVASLQGLAQWTALFPFSIDPVPRKDIEHSGRIELFRQGVDEEMVLLRT